MNIPVLFVGNEAYFVCKCSTRLQFRDIPSKNVPVLCTRCKREYSIVCYATEEKKVK